MTDEMPEGWYHLLGELAESEWNEWLYQSPDPEAYGLVIDFTPDPGLFEYE